MKIHRFIYFAILSILLISCEQEVIIDLPEYKPKLVVEGYIESNGYPMITLSKSIPYFEPIDTDAVRNLYVGNEATVIVYSRNDVDTLQCMGFGNYRFFVGTKFKGEVGESYKLKIIYDGKAYTATTSIPYPVPLDSVKFYPDPDLTGDTLGFLWIYVTDPDTLGNYYRIFTKTLGQDPVFVHPNMSVDEDKYFNGQKLEFSVYHGRNMLNEDDTTGNEGVKKWYHFEMGDTVVVKWCSLDRQHFLFWRTVEQQQQSDGNPFAAPVTPYTNISGGALGIWGGYGVYLDTVVITPNIIRK